MGSPAKERQGLGDCAVADIRLFVCCHRQEQIPSHPLLAPVQVGTALAPERFAGFLHDDEGENISAKNRSYCELTAQYWAWKNVQADYYGFFHYRRYLYPDPAARRPYKLARALEPGKLGYDGFGQLIEQYDLILPKAENMYVPVREHYAAAPYHRGRDLALAEQIVLERCPEMEKAAQAYLGGTEQYFGNIYIMRRALFQDYCGWLFPILEAFDSRADTEGLSPQQMRVDGYLAERLLGIYARWRRPELKVLELPRVHLYEGGQYAARVALNALLPPGTRRRSVIKALER